MKTIILTRRLMLTLATAALVVSTAHPQTRTLLREDPRNLRADPRSPDQRFEWRVETGDPVRYELVEIASQRVLTTVKDYFCDQDHAFAAWHARGVSVYWNDRSNLVALDEFNYRRAGDLHFFWVQNGQAKPIRIEALIKRPPDATEARFCVRDGWESATRLSIRLAAQLRSGEVISKAYVVDLSDPVHPNATAEP